MHFKINDIIDSIEKRYNIMIALEILIQTMLDSGTIVITDFLRFPCQLKRVLKHADHFLNRIMNFL